MHRVPLPHSAITTLVVALTAAFTAAMVLIPSALLAQGPNLSGSVMEYVSVDAPIVALTDVTVVDGTGAEPMAGQTVLIENGRISAVGPTAEIDVPEGAEVHELTGHTVIPGLIGMHNHTFYTTSGRRAQLAFSAPRLYLASGVTSIRTTGSYHPYSEINLKRAIEAGEALGPRMHITGPYITGSGTSGYMTEVASPEDARRVVNYWADEGATWFKAYTTISRAELEAAIEEAHSRGLKFTGHLCSVSFREAVELGIDNLEHGLFTNSDYAPGKEPDECPSNLRDPLPDLDMGSEQVQATFRDMVENDVPMTSTLAVYELMVPERPPLEDRVRDALAPTVWEEYLATRNEIAENADGSPWPAYFSKAQEFERAFVDAGGLLGAGVDPTGIGGALPGYGDQRNFELLIEGGFTPVEAIEIMSANGAKILGVYDELGSIEAGKIADLVVIDGNPIANPAEIRNVTLVFKDGFGYDSARLIESVQGVVGIR